MGQGIGCAIAVGSGVAVGEGVRAGAGVAGALGDGAATGVGLGSDRAADVVEGIVVAVTGVADGEGEAAGAGVQPNVRRRASRAINVPGKFFIPKIYCPAKRPVLESGFSGGAMGGGQLWNAPAGYIRSVACKPGAH